MVTIYYHYLKQKNRMMYTYISMKHVMMYIKILFQIMSQKMEAISGHSFMI